MSSALVNSSEKASAGRVAGPVVHIGERQMAFQRSGQKQEDDFRTLIAGTERIDYEDEEV